MVVAAFQSWGDNTSALILASVRGQEDVDAFIASHYSSGTHAELHTYECEDEAYSDWAALQEIVWYTDHDGNIYEDFEQSIGE